MTADSGIWVRQFYHTATVMGSPGFLQESPLLSEGGGDGEKACPPDGALGWQNALADLALDDTLHARS